MRSIGARPAAGVREPARAFASAVSALGLDVVPAILRPGESIELAASRG
jgi:hypothetical protein